MREVEEGGSEVREVRWEGEEGELEVR